MNVHGAFSSFTLCTKSKIKTNIAAFAVRNLNTTTSTSDGSKLNDQNGFKLTGDETKDNSSNEAQSSTTYSVVHTMNHEQRNFSLIEEVVNSAHKASRMRISTSDKNHNFVQENTKTGSRYRNENTPKHMQNKKKSLNTQEDIQLVYKKEIASLDTAVQVTCSKGVTTIDMQPTVEEESDLLENAKKERKWNKQRVRAKKMEENKHLSPSKAMDKFEFAYQNAQREIDKVLHPQKKENDLEKKKKNKAEPSRQSNCNDILPSFQERHFTRTDQVVQADLSMNKEKIHSPMHFHYSRDGYNQTGMIMWNPYRTYDDATLICSSNSEVKYTLFA